MYINKEYLLELLPPYRDAWVTISADQDVGDIITEVVESHKLNENFYDCIGGCFIGGGIDSTCDNLANFISENIAYKMESEHVQRVITPQGILTRGYGDCKHYASFAGGCLGAIERLTGEKIDWYYCFASYRLDESTPYHVFVVVSGPNGEIFIDPTPGAYGSVPVYSKDVRVKSSLNKKVAGVGAYQPNLQVTGSMLPVPSWYPSALPRYYLQPDGHTVLLRPQNAVPKFTDADVLDCMVLLQMLMGDGRRDGDNSYNICWQDFPGSNVFERIKFVFLNDPGHDNDWDFAQYPTQSINHELEKQLKDRINFRLSVAYPYLPAINARGTGIVNQSIPYPNSQEVARPSWYPAALPSLFYKDNGYLTTFFKIGNYKPDASEVSKFMVYAFPVVASGKQPYNINWFLNGDFNGAKYAAYFIGFVENGGQGFFGNDFLASGEVMNYVGFARWQDYSLFPAFAVPHKTSLLDSISSLAVEVVQKIPVLSSAWTAVNAVATAMNAGDLPTGTFSAEVGNDAKMISATITQEQTAADSTKKYLLIGFAALLGIGYYYRKEIKKYFE